MSVLAPVRELTKPAASDAAATALIASVASKRVQQEVGDSYGRHVLFRIVGLDSQLTSAVARRIKADLPKAIVEIHEDLADDTLPLSMRSRRNVADYRNSPRPEGSGAIVFAVPAKQLDVVGKTADDIQQISEDVLISMPELWLACAPEFASLEGRPRDSVLNILKGLVQSSRLAGGLPMFGAFVERFASLSGTESLERALDHALPALRIPREAGRFKPFAAKGRVRAPEGWATKFKELYDLADDALNLRKSDGTPFSRAALKDRVKDLISSEQVNEAEGDVLAALVADPRIEPGSWTRSQQDAVELRWSALERLFKGSKKKVQEPIGQATLNFFRVSMPKEVSDDDVKILEAMGSEAVSADEDERDFFFRQRANIAQEKALLKRWEQYVFRRSETHIDLSIGLLTAISDLIEGAQNLPEQPCVYVRLHGADKKAFWTKQNRDLCRFLRDRYRGFPEVLRSAGVYLDFGMCWSGDWDSEASSAPNNARAAREFKFDIFVLDLKDLREKGDSAEPALRTAVNTGQMLWVLPADSVASAYSENLLEVANLAGEYAFLASGQFGRAQSQDRSHDGRISLQRRATFLDASDKPNGVLADANITSTIVDAAFESSFANQRDGVLSAEAATAIEQAYRAFKTAYTEAVRATVSPTGKGLAAPELLLQAECYGELLHILRVHARKDRCREELWKPMLTLGIAQSDDRPPIAICCPYHPFKLAGAAAKAATVRDGLKRILTGASADIRTFSRDLARAVAGGWHPAVAVQTSSPSKSLLVETESFADFGLMEPPTRDQGAIDAFDGYSDVAAEAFLEIADEYLELQPHERSNFSLVLYNADNRSLPSRLADMLASKIEGEKDLRCDLVLTHSDQKRLRQIYAEQNVAISARLDGALASEATQGFLSRLRVGFLDIGGFRKGEESVHAADLVLLHDVIARSAKSSWRKIADPDQGWPTFLEHSPDTETRRRPFEAGALKTESLLVPAERPEEVQQYLNLLRDYLRADNDLPEGNYVPVREITFDDDGVGAVINQAHEVARWVVTYDAIADLQLFRNNGVNIIRFITKPGSDHNVVVSTRKHSPVLVSKLTEECAVILGEKQSEARKLADLCIECAAKISGRVVLRAARHENNALELLGLILSQRIILDSLPETTVPVCWLLLDDFADWLGHKGKKADILAICLSEADGVPIIDLLVIESKFVALAAESASMSESFEQMRASTNDLRDRIVAYEDALNRRTWLGRLADLLLEHGTFSGSVVGRDPSTWARIIRSDEGQLRITGLSFVFVHDRLDGSAEPIEGQNSEQRQFTFDRDGVAKGLRRIREAGHC